MVLTMVPHQAFATETEQTTAEITEYAVTWSYTAEHMTIEGAATAVAGEAYTATLTEAACCDVLSFDVRINKVYIDEAEYTYTQSTGVLTIPAGLIDGDISINVLSRQKHTEATRTEEFAATCMEAARTDTVRYCTECGLELSRSTGYGDYAPHEKGTEPGRLEPTCLASGGTGYYCKYGCGTLLIEEALEQLPHTPGERELSGEWYIIHCAVCGSAYDTEYALTRQEAAEKMLKLVNDLRAEHGLNPLVLTREAIDLATLRAAELVDDYSHTSAGGYNDGYGENIIASDASIEGMFDRWCLSPGHLANMLGEGYEEFGFGFFEAENGQALYGVQLFNFHADKDLDHACDRGCEGTLGTHEDTVGDGDHICDYCRSGEALTACSGGSANCMYEAYCEECGQPYGEKDPDRHESEEIAYTHTLSQHTAIHVCCYAEAATENHTYENGLCVCGKEEPAGYGYPENFYWELDKYGAMVIIGTGAIENGAAWAAYASQVKNLEIDSRITSIGEDAFAGFANLTTLYFPGTAQVAKNAFSGCAALKNITVTGTGAMADWKDTYGNLPWFQSTQEMTVTLEAGLTTVSACAFCGAEKVTAVVLPEGIETIGEKAFRGCGLSDISIPGTVKTIEAGALSELKSCVVLELPDSVETLGDGALSGSAFQAVKLPGDLTAIGSELLKNCESLNTVNIPEGVTVIGREAFRGCKVLMGIHIPDAVTRIEEGAFRGCSMLYAVTLPETLTEVGAYAFAADTYLVTLTIKCKELTIGNNAFTGCTALSRVYFNGSKAQWEALEIGSGNGALTGATVYCDTETGGPVQRLHILHKSGLPLAVDEALEGRNILVDMGQSSEVVLGYAIWPEDAVNKEIIWDNNNRTVVDAAVNEAGGYTLTGKQAGDVTVVVMNYGSGKDYTYANSSVRFQFRKMVLSDSFRGYMTPNTAQYLAAYIEGDGDLDRGIRWTLVEDQTGEATLTPDGLLSVGSAVGTVTVRAEAADGSGLCVEATVTVTDYAVLISGPARMELASGKSITLAAEFVPSNLTDTEILWKLEDPEDAQFVTLKNGKVTAKTVKEAHEVVVVAYPADGVAAPAAVTVTVVPLTSSVAIFRDEETVTGKTISVNLNTLQEPIRLTAVTAPADAAKAVNWTESSKGSLVTLQPQADGTVLVVPNDKTGTVTLTATAADGSGRKAIVKLQLVRSATAIQILNAPQEPIRAGSKLNLTTTVATEAGLTDRSVVWSLSEESLPYASISAKGVLTTYAYPGQVTITVRAAVKSELTICDEKTIVLKPGATAAVIGHKGEALAKNEIVYAQVGEAVILTGSVLPEEAIQGGTWKVSGKGAVLTDNGDGTAAVTVNTAGTATVTFTANDGSKKATTVKLQAIQRGGEMTITAAKNATELRSGKTLQMTAAVPGATLKKFNWTVDKPELATVSNTGKVKALTVYENTTVTVTATAIDGSGLTADYKLLLRPAKDQTLHIRLNGEVVTGTTRYLHLNGAGQTLTVELYDSITGQWTAVTANLTLGGKNLEVKEGILTGVKTGTGTVTAKYGKLSAKVTFKVVNPVEAITLYEKSGTCHTVVGKSLTLKANIFGAGGQAPTEKKLKWTVDDPAAATVSASGVVKANKNLTRQTVVTVTASATDGSGVSATQKITLYPLPTAILISADNIVLNQCVREFKVGDTLTLDAKILPGDALQDVTFSISGKLATLATAEDGTVTLRLNAKGTLTIKAATKDGSKRTMTVKIKIVE